MLLKPYDHTTSQEAHTQSLTDLHAIVTKEQSIKIVPRPTKRYLRKLELNYLYCRDCESQKIYRNGKSSMGIQRFRCKGCGCQFVAQFDALFPQSKRQSIFSEEYLSNLKPIGLEKGCGQKKYWSGARLETLQMLESQIMRVKANKIIKSFPIYGSRDLRVLKERLLHEAYGLVRQ